MAQVKESDVNIKIREEIEIHIEDHLYDRTKLDALEDYVNKQVSGKATYDFHSNLYLMKMYSMFPSSAKKDIVIKLLLKAMMNLPDSDFTSLVYLIPITMQTKEEAPSKKEKTNKNGQEIAVILNLGQYLEDCEFDSFWAEYFANKHLFESYRGFEMEIRRYICQMIQSVYQNVPVSFACELLELSDEGQLEECIKALDLRWTIDRKTGKAQMPKTDENSDGVQRTTQFVSTDSMNQILATFSTF